jgi:predicted secreted hydrolase
MDVGLSFYLPDGGFPRHAPRQGAANQQTGEVRVSGDRYEIRAHGNRDKSWGVRNSQTPRMWRGFSLNFGDDCAMGAVRLQMSDAEVHRGWIFRDGRNVSVRRIALATEN